MTHKQESLPENNQDDDKLGRYQDIILDLSLLINDPQSDISTVANFVEDLESDDWRPLLTFLLEELRLRHAPKLRSVETLDRSDFLRDYAEGRR